MLVHAEARGAVRAGQLAGAVAAVERRIHAHHAVDDARRPRIPVRRQRAHDRPHVVTPQDARTERGRDPCHLGVVGVPHPYRGEARGREADREDILEIVGRARLERRRSSDTRPRAEHERAVGIGVVLQHVGHDPGDALIEHALPFDLRVIADDLAVAVGDLQDHRGLDADPHVRDDLVRARHVDEAHLTRPDAEREAELRAVPFTHDAELMDHVDDRVDAHGASDLKSRHVERLA